MRFLLPLIASALCLAGCATLPAPAPATGGTAIPATPNMPAPATSTVEKASSALAYADAAVDRAYFMYGAIRDTARLVLPYLSADRQARALALEDTIEAGFAKARAATDLAVRAAALATAAKSVQKLEGLTVDRN